MFIHFVEYYTLRLLLPFINVFFLVQSLQSQQLTRIKELEKEVTEMRSTHTGAIQDLKSKFLAEKKTYQDESDSKINTMTRLANTVRIIT